MNDYICIHLIQHLLSYLQYLLVVLKQNDSSEIFVFGSSENIVANSVKLHMEQGNIVSKSNIDSRYKHLSWSPGGYPRQHRHG